MECVHRKEKQERKRKNKPSKKPAVTYWFILSILWACQLFLGYFMPRNLGIALIVCWYLHFCEAVLKAFAFVPIKY